MRDATAMSRKIRPMIQCAPHMPEYLVISIDRNLRLHKLQDDPLFPEAPAVEQHYRIYSVHNTARPIRSLDWYPGRDNPFLMAIGDATGEVNLVNFKQDSVQVLRTVTQDHPRQCHALAWNPIDKTYLAAGLDKSRNDCSVNIWDMNYLDSSSLDHSESPLSVSNELESGDTKHYSGFSGDFDHDKKLDFTAGKKEVVEQYTPAEGASSLSWLPGERELLAVGTTFKWLRIYDLRIPLGENEMPPLSVVAHQKNVHGVVFDQFAPHCFATFSESREVKIWDSRSIMKAVACITTKTNSIMQIGWSPTRAGLLTAVSTENRCVLEWDIRNPVTLSLDDPIAGETPASVPYLGVPDKHATEEDLNDRVTLAISRVNSKRYVTRPALAFAWRPKTESEKAPSFNEGRRLLLVASNGELSEKSLQDPPPLSISPGARLACSLNNYVIERSIVQCDRSFSLYARARLGYSLNAEENCKLLETLVSRATLAPSQQKDVVSTSGSFTSESAFFAAATGNPLNKEELAPCVKALERLLDLWKWIYRATVTVNPNNPPGLRASGICTLLRNDDLDETKSTLTLKPGFKLHRSKKRSMALQLCGWGDFGTAPNLAISQCEARGYLRRAAALAIFDCNLKQAVGILRTAAKEATGDSDVLEIVSMAWSGFPTSPQTQEVAELWRSSCVNLKQKLGDFPLLRYCCDFLIAVHDMKVCYNIEELERYPKDTGDASGSSEGAQDAGVQNMRVEEIKRRGANAMQRLVKIVDGESSMCLADRVAFACRFLPDDQLDQLVNRETRKSVRYGSLDGMLLTGLDRQGMQLLQKYVDYTSDVQTAALVASRALTRPMNHEDFCNLERWMAAYRELLNVWQLWHIRGAMDVELAELKRQNDKKKDNKDKTKGDETPEQSLVAHLAQDPQITVVCHDCKQSVFLSDLLGDSKAIGSSGQISRKKATLPCCPKCKRRLPSCALCTLPMNCFNPYAQMMGLSQRDRARHAPPVPQSKHRLYHRANSSGHSATANKEKVNGKGTGQAFGQWFSWCLRCRHGGHAACLMEWFKGHSRCPVSDCDCQCVEDAIYHDEDPLAAQQTAKA